MLLLITVFSIRGHCKEKLKISSFIGLEIRCSRMPVEMGSGRRNRHSLPPLRTVKQHWFALTANTVREPNTHVLLLEGTAFNNTLQATHLMVNAALPIQLCVQDLPGWLHTRLQPSQTYRCIQCSPCQNLALTTPTHFCFGSLGDKTGLQATDFHLYNAEKPKVGSAGAAHPA